MKVSDLIEELQQYDKDAEVHFAYNYGDYWRTTVAPKVRRIELLPVVHSEYHSMPKVINDEEDERYAAATERVVVIS